MNEPAEDTRARHASEFLPSRHGFAFPNAWDDHVVKLAVGGKPFTISLKGRCGGMAFAALDYYRIGIEAFDLAPRTMPDPRSALARYLLRRQFTTLAGGAGANMARFVAWTYRPTCGPSGAAALTRGREAGAVLAAMVAGNPVPLGTVTADRLAGMGLNHQVVAYASEADAHGLRVYVYDPNFPGRDDVWLEFDWEGDDPITEYVGGNARKLWRGMFVERYRPMLPPGVRRVSPEGGGA